ncbi:MAG: C-terminal glycine zipper region [Acidobacteriota bacterium]|nr:C-terminal glycine zipper region [Acidobacteriota bacterium]
MSQNANDKNKPSTGGAGTGATDAGTTRDTSASTGTSFGSTGGGSSASGGGSSTGGSGSTGGGSTGKGSGAGTLATSGAGGGAGAATGTAAAREGIAGTAQEYGQKIADAASQAKDYMSDKLTPAVDKFNELRQKDYAQVADDAKEYARQNPGQAILVSAAAGFLLGLLLRGTSRR